MNIYMTLFVISFGAATFLPASSEAVVLFALSQKEHFFYVWLIATVGNTLGSCINYLIGAGVLKWATQKSPKRQQRHQKYQASFNRWGGWLLLLSWAPIIGDPITMVAGGMRYPFYRFLFIVSLAKGARYGVLVGVYFVGVS